MINGNECILTWNDEPIACLTSNSITEAMSFLATCKRTFSGASSHIPSTFGYTLTFEAVMVSGMGMSWDELSLLVRTQEIGSWGLTYVNDTGRGYLANLELVANSGENIIFTGSIQGIGIITPLDAVYYVWFQDIDTYVDEGTKYVLVS